MRRPRLSPWRPRSPRICFIRTKSWKRRARSWLTAIRSSKRFRACLRTPASTTATRSNRWTGTSSDAAGRANAGLPRRRVDPCLSMSRARLLRCRSRGQRYRHRRHRMFDGHRDADAGSAGRRAAWFSYRRVTRAHIRSGMRGRRVGPVNRVAARAGAARHQRAAGRARTLHTCRPPRRIDQGQYCRRQPVR